jgi:hypothetical protein
MEAHVGKGATAMARRSHRGRDAVRAPRQLGGRRGAQGLSTPSSPIAVAPSIAPTRVLRRWRGEPPPLSQIRFISPWITEYP